MCNFIIKIIFFIALVVPITSCNENIFRPYSGNNDFINSLDTDIAYISDNCKQVIKNLEYRATTDTLTVHEKYQYVTSELACSNFDVSRALSMAISTSGDIAPLDIMYPLIGTNQYTLGNIKNLFITYDKIMPQCIDRVDDRLRVVCALSATAINTISITKTVMELLTVGQLQADFEIIRKQLEPMFGATSTIIANTVLIYPSLSFNDSDNISFEQRLTTSSNFIAENSTSIEKILGLKGNAAIFDIFDALSDGFLGETNKAQGLGIMIDELFYVAP